MFELSKEFPDQLILGMEIRDLVANYVVQKISSLRINSGYKDCLNIGVVKTNTMKTLHNYFRKESVSISVCVIYVEYSLKRCSSVSLTHTSRSRITEEESSSKKLLVINTFSTTLLSDYAHVLKVGGKIYVITDVKDLYDWEVEHLEMHPLFEKVGEEETKSDPCIKFMREGTDEA